MVQINRVEMRKALLVFHSGEVLEDRDLLLMEVLVLLEMGLIIIILVLH